VTIAAVSRGERAVEDVGHPHEHFVDPAIVAGDRYPAPAAPGSSTPMRAGALTRYAYPEGSAWQ
jgi:L-fuconate dehydratase